MEKDPMSIEVMKLYRAGDPIQCAFVKAMETLSTGKDHVASVAKLLASEFKQPQVKYQDFEGEFEDEAKNIVCD
jgi:hypothetical protein